MEIYSQCLKITKRKVSFYTSNASEFSGFKSAFWPFFNNAKTSGRKNKKISEFQWDIFGHFQMLCFMMDFFGF